MPQRHIEIVYTCSGDQPEAAVRAALLCRTALGRPAIRPTRVAERSQPRVAAETHQRSTHDPLCQNNTARAVPLGQKMSETRTQNIVRQRYYYYSRLSPTEEQTRCIKRVAKMQRFRETSDKCSYDHIKVKLGQECRNGWFDQIKVPTCSGGPVCSCRTRQESGETSLLSAAR